MDLAAFRYTGSTKSYPPEESTLSYPLPKNYYISSIELAFRKDIIDKIQFDKRFGIGASIFQSGEDAKFLHDAIKAGLHCKFFPITICTHNHPSTGDKAMTNGVSMAEGKLIQLQHPHSWILRIPLKAWRNTKKGGKFLPTLCHLFRGAFVRL